MIGKLGRPATILVKAIVAINVLANLFAWLLTSVYFGILLPPMVVGNATEGIWDRMVFVLVAFGFVVSIIAPINARRVFPLIREARRRLEPVRSKDRDESETDALHRLAGKLLRLPVKLAVTTLLGWLIGAIALLKVPHTFPWIFPWTHELSHRMAAWMVFVAAPITVCWVFFSQEHWLRKKMPEFFPAEALRSVPPTFRINVLPKMLVVSLIITTIPVIMVSHVTLHQIQEIQAGRQSIAVFLDHMPVIIWFLSAVFVVVAAGLSIFMSKSFSEPLKKFESAMDTIREGHLDVTVPVVSNDEIGHTAEGFNRMIHEHRELDSVRDTFGRYLSREVVDEILKSPGGVELRGEMRYITILVSDLRGFTRITESLSPQQVLEILNRYLEVMTDIIIRHRGTIDEFTGDGILVFFGAPRAMADHCRRAVACALEMQAAMTHLNRQNELIGLPGLYMGIGINCGQLVVGNIGSEKRKKYGAVGSPINLAFRIEAETRGGEILLSPTVLENFDGDLIIDASKEAHLKGLDKPLTLYRVVGMQTTT